MKLKFEVQESKDIYEWKDIEGDFHVAILSLHKYNGSYLSHALYIGVGNDYKSLKKCYFLNEGLIRKPGSAEEAIKGNYFCGDVIGKYLLDKDGTYKIEIEL